MKMFCCHAFQRKNLVKVNEKKTKDEDIFLSFLSFLFYKALLKLIKERKKKKDL